MTDLQYTPIEDIDKVKRSQLPFSQTVPTATAFTATIREPGRQGLASRIIF
jgi:hypothetical protein